MGIEGQWEVYLCQIGKFYTSLLFFLVDLLEGLDFKGMSQLLTVIILFCFVFYWLLWTHPNGQKQYQNNKNANNPLSNETYSSVIFDALECSNIHKITQSLPLSNFK